ncbi:MAG: gliding motility-associated ABC transporter permease subunit GldF [Bacteroidetes bacterium]|nr:MAG: gliding motility-associated ABC transporter permease subunit GldF [Bacteroidota bacterium]
MFALYKKEIAAFLNTLIGYVVILVFLLITGLFLWVFPTEYNILDFAYANLDPFFMLAPFVFLFLIPAISMRMFSEEKKTGTIELLFTRPLNDLQIIGAKYLAGLSLVIIAIIPSLIYVLSVYWLGFPYGNLDLGIIWGSYIGLIFLASAFVSIGLFSSAITDNQIIAFIIGISISAFAYLGFEIIYSLDLFGNFDLFVQSLGIQAHYTSIRRGVIDLRDLIYFISLTALFLLFTHTLLSRRKW